MNQVSKFIEHKKINTPFSKEHDRIVKKYNIDIISLRGSKISFICLYDIIQVLFINSSIELKNTDIILITLLSVSLLSKENTDTISNINNVCKERNITRYLELVKSTIKSLKNLLNIILKKDGAVIQNIEQALKYRNSVDVLSIVKEYLELEKIEIKDFAYWYIVDQRTKKSNELVDYANINYFL